MKINRSIIALAIVLGASTAANATVLGFGQIGGSNTDIPTTFGSNITGAVSGIDVSNGTTPNIALTWGADWDVHTTNNFSHIEGKTVGGAWDNEGAVRVAQLDGPNHTIGFSATPGFRFVLNSFDFGHSPETPGTTVWNIELTDALAVVRWDASITFVNGMVETFSPAFTGEDGASYTLTFTQVSTTYPQANGRHAIDNLSFSQVAVPEPSSAALLGLAGVVLLSRRRK